MKQLILILAMALTGCGSEEESSEASEVYSYPENNFDLVHEGICGDCATVQYFSITATDYFYPKEKEKQETIVYFTTKKKSTVMSFSIEGLPYSEDYCEADSTQVFDNYYFWNNIDLGAAFTTKIKCDYPDEVIDLREHTMTVYVCIQAELEIKNYKLYGSTEIVDFNEDLSRYGCYSHYIPASK